MTAPAFQAPPLSAFFRKEEELLVTHGLADVHTPAMFHHWFEIGELIGRGSVSMVYACRHKTSNEQFAVKVINKQLCLKKKSLRDEIAVLMRVKHPNIITLEAVYESDTELYLVMERATGGELFDRIVQVGVYSERQATEIVANLLLAIEYLHDHNILHRDIKPENLLLATSDSRHDIKISDFGIAKILEDEDDDMTGYGRANVRGRAYTSCGTDYYVAPEVLNDNGYDSKVDLWSLGVVVYIMLCGFPPFTEDETGMESVYRKITSGVLEFPDPYWTNVSDIAKSFLRNLLNVDPVQRFSAEQALEHPWIRARTMSASQEPLDSAIHEMRRFNQKRRFS
ncbi:CAMK/CAMK1 protein kinase [Saprolegnia diclina VS20]|uniref:CAMK/CAMK1 protein kinase n=1 Tax=Saprolegnia diclina (strain VS20) TaxID=1156394 RepID=T0PQK2_SAPDV|nr:CAMK/CAMK1 protein kinase [Saprolegnia diclina VS20]EQC27789.1 CAMK/CAMK1 protein kinase [Saprolegnia diclina VS20]|eukprot:XP_008618719.1 CAMK/CAMK1 protein kinase [Saprolegnia diclina VS20]